MRIFFTIPLSCLLLFAAACTESSGPPGANDAISRDLFVQTYYELRIAALINSDMEIGLTARDSILNHLGVTEEELLYFAEVWGGEGEFMQGIWEEVTNRMQEQRQDRALDPSIDGYEPGGGEEVDERGGEGVGERGGGEIDERGGGGIDERGGGETNPPLGERGGS